MNNKAIEILIIEDNSSDFEIAERELKKANRFLLAVSGIHWAPSLADAEVFLKDNVIDVVLLDFSLPDSVGFSGIETLLSLAPNIPVVVLTGRDDEETAIKALQHGAQDYVVKGNSDVSLARAIRYALERSKRGELAEALIGSLPSNPIIGSSKEQQELIEQAERLAKVNSTVLIRGESGTGKTHLSQFIHNMSVRADKPFLLVNCAAMPKDLLEAELFGHEKGAFTGANASRPGRFELADGGTIMLDEIGDMPLSLQPKLLHFLQDRKVRRIGGREERELNVRIISATHKDLEELCDKGEFRRDLFFRLNVGYLHILPLRERPQDLEDLITYTLESLKRRFQRPSLEISDEALEVLCSYSWPGNIRELQNVLERSVILGKSETSIEVDDVQSYFISNQSFSTSEETDGHESLSGLSLKEVERKAIVDTLISTGGNRTKAARLLQISDKSLYNKVKAYNIDVTGLSE